MKPRLRYGVRTDPGLERDHNEDSYIVVPDSGIFAVIDGMGGHNAGELAAAIAQRELEARLLRPEGTVEEALLDGITIANNKIFQEASKSKDLHGMACVLSAVVIEDGNLTFGHVGDSRIYKLHQGVIRKLTHDHSPVGEREDRGELTELEAMRHLRRNEVYRDVGTELHAPTDQDFIELQTQPFEPDCALLLCSDGLTDLVTQGIILETLLAYAGNPQRSVEVLVDKALEAGGKDNVTVIVVEGAAFSRPGAETLDEVPTARQLGSGDTTRRMGGPVPLPPLPVEALLRPPPQARLPRWLLALALVEGLIILALAGLLLRPTPEKPLAVVSPLLRTVKAVRAGENLQAAVNAATPGTVISLGPGEYVGPLEMRSHITIIAQEPVTKVPPSTVIVAPPGSDGPLLKAAHVEDAGLFGVQLGRVDHAVAVAGVLEDTDLTLGAVRIMGARDVALKVTGPKVPLLWGLQVDPATPRDVEAPATSQPVWLQLHLDAPASAPALTPAPPEKVKPPASAVPRGASGAKTPKPRADVPAAG